MAKMSRKKFNEYYKAIKEETERKVAQAALESMQVSLLYGHAIIKIDTDLNFKVYKPGEPLT